MGSPKDAKKRPLVQLNCLWCREYWSNLLETYWEDLRVPMKLFCPRCNKDGDKSTT